MPNVLSAGPKNCGRVIASERNSVRRRDCESKDFAAAAIENQHDLDVALADEADRQKRRADTSPRKTFMITGISEPFDWRSGLILVCVIALRVVQDNEVSLQNASELRCTVSKNFANKLSLNLLQDR